jgi:hypothetical protein
MTDPTEPTPAPDAANAVWLDPWGNEVTPWQSTPNMPTTFRDAIDQIGGPSGASGSR